MMIHLADHELLDLIAAGSHRAFAVFCQRKLARLLTEAARAGALKPDAALVVRTTLYQVWIDGLAVPPRSSIDQALATLMRRRLRPTALITNDDRPVPTASAALSDQEVADLAHELFSQAAVTGQRPAHRIGLWDLLFRRA